MKLAGQIKKTFYTGSLESEMCKLGVVVKCILAQTLSFFELTLRG